MIFSGAFFVAKAARRPLTGTSKLLILAMSWMPDLRDILELTAVLSGEFSTGPILLKDVSIGKRLRTGGGKG